MSGWIKIDKDLAETIRFRRVVRKLRDSSNALRSVTDALAVTIVSGALQRFWVYADSHIRDDNTLDITPDEINEIVGVEGFAQALPADWLQVIDTDQVKLPDFLEHNGSSEKHRRDNARRQATYRDRHKSRNVTRYVTGSNARNDARPDQIRKDQTRPEERETRTREHVGVRDCGTGLTEIGQSLECWRRDVPECSPDAFARWIVHCETTGKMLGAAQRLGQAKLLAGNGDFAAQAEVVDYCILQGWKTLVPLRDVRVRRDGMTRGGKPERERWRPPTDDPKAGAA